MSLSLTCSLIFIFKFLWRRWLRWENRFNQQTSTPRQCFYQVSISLIRELYFTFRLLCSGGFKPFHHLEDVLFLVLHGLSVFSIHVNCAWSFDYNYNLFLKFLLVLSTFLRIRHWTLIFSTGYIFQDFFPISLPLISQPSFFVDQRQEISLIT